MPAGPQLKLNFDGDFVFNTRSNYEQCIHKPCSHEKNADVYVKHNDKIEKGKIIGTPLNEEEDLFYIQLDNHDIHPFMVSDIHLTNLVPRAKGMDHLFVGRRPTNTQPI